MSVIIRLQNLPWAANAADIRQYFQGLSIPEGGVHIVGGEKGDAFISFSTDEDARQAMLADGGCIKDIQIRLLLSSRNEMQKVIETARQQAMQLSQVFMQQMQQQQQPPPQLPVVGSLQPPLTAKVLPQPQQQQPMRQDRTSLLHRNQSQVMDQTAGTMLMSQDKVLQLQQQQQVQVHLSPKLVDCNSRVDDRSGGHKRERTRSKSRDRRSKSSRSGGGGSNRRDRSKSRDRDRRRRDRSRGRDRSRDRHRGGDENRNSSSRSSGGKAHRSRSPGSKPPGGGGDQPIRPWIYQYNEDIQSQQQQQQQQNYQQYQQQLQADGMPNMQGSVFPGLQQPPQPPVVHQGAPLHSNATVYQQHQMLQNRPQQQPPPEWAERQHQQLPQQQAYVPNNNFRTNMYGATGGNDDDNDEDDDDDENDDDEDDDDDHHEDDRRRAEFVDHDEPYKRYGDNRPPPGRRGPSLGQDFRGGQQPYFGGRGGSRFHKPPQQQQSAPGGMLNQQQNHGGSHRGSYEQRFGGGGTPRFNSRPPPADGVQDGGGGGNRGGRQTRFSSVHEGGRPSRFNPAPVPPLQQQQQSPSQHPEEFNGKRVPQPPRYNDRYRYDVRNTQLPPPQVRADGLCVEVNNMGNHFSYGDVRKLFEGIHIDGSAIKIQKHRQGVAFVRFDSNHNKNAAMRLNGTTYKGNLVSVAHLDDDAYERDNTDDRPYPIAPPTVVDHVDLMDDDDDGGGGGERAPPSDEHNDDKNKQQQQEKEQQPQQQKKEPQQQQQQKKNISTDDRSENDDDDGSSNLLVVCEKNDGGGSVVIKDGGVEGDADEEQPPSREPEPPTKFLKLKQLPITVTEQDVLNEIDSGGGEVRRVTFHPDGEFLGCALEFHSVAAAESTLKRFDCVLLGSTPVPVLRCSYKEYAQIKRNAIGGGGGGGKRFDGNRHHNHHHHHQSLLSSLLPQPSPVPQPPTMPVPPTIRSNCVYLYGLPTTVTNTDITQFFSDMSVLPDKIHIMLSKFGRPTGESYCEFSTAQQAHTALGKDQTYMGPALVYVEPISRPDMIQAITKPMQQRNHHHPPQPHHQDVNWGGGPPRHHHNHHHHHHQHGGGNMMQQSTPRHHMPGPPPSFNGGAYGGGGGGNRFMNNGGGGNGGGRGGGIVTGYAPRIRGPGPGPNTGPDGFGQPGCVVALDNVPYRADVQEIVEFFEGFDLVSQNVIRRFNDFGKPTGEARVNLRNPQEAVRAVRVLQNKPIFNRPVRLTLL